MFARLLPAAFLALSLAASQAALAHSFSVGDLQIGHPWARPTVAKQPTGGAYLSVENRGKAADNLLSASSPAASEVQIHTMKMEGTTMRMREVPKLEVAPGAKVTMAPGDGYHLMLIGLKQPLKVGDKFPMQLVFEKAGAVEVTVNVEDKPKSSAAPAEHQHKH
jgi:copper(I)-binding protein